MINKQQILIVDDDKNIREMLSSALTDDYFIFQAENGQSALKYMESFHIDLVLVDMIMPGQMGGVDFVKKAQKKFPDTAYIIVSGNQDLQSTIDAFQVGIGDYIQKPVTNLPVFKRKLKALWKKGI